MLELLRTYLPSFISGINNDRKISAKVKRFKERYEALTSKLVREGDSHANPHSIYEWMVAAKIGDTKSASFLKFLDDVFHFCLNEINPRLRSKIQLIGFNILTAFDTDITLQDNPTYLTYLGELLTTHRVLSHKTKYDLLDIEAKMPNGKKADFLLKDNDSGINILVDAVSVVGFNPSVPNDASDVVKYFHDRFKQKLEAKLSDMPAGGTGPIDEELTAFMILPILWNEVIDLKSWNSVFKSSEIQYQGSLALSILLVQKDEDGNYSFLFTTVNQALDSV